MQICFLVLAKFSLNGICKCTLGNVAQKHFRILRRFLSLWYLQGDEQRNSCSGRQPVRNANVTGIIGNLVLVNSGFLARNIFFFNIFHSFGTLSQSFYSPVLGLKSLKNVCVNGEQYYSPAWGAHFPRFRPGFCYCSYNVLKTWSRFSRLLFSEQMWQISEKKG
jgi:hypothetical protein